ncbi:MAG: signal peptide peptidase SppA [Candidatus Woesearchaeota archaeon]|nr:MAG: signal peptide peptidase SppA [Candidatus Woesearchaeota archaeon]
MKQKWIMASAIIIGLFILAQLFSLGAQDDIKNGNVAVIPVQGTIVATGESGVFQDSVVSSDEVLELIDKATRDPRIKAIVFEINSPGGSAVASDEVGQAIKAIDLPTVAHIREVGASGGYWIASTTDYIVANRMSMTGSIGVIASFLDFSGFIERYNVSYERFVSGEYKDLGTPFRKVTNEERDIFQEKLDMIHDYFIQEVYENRHLSKDDESYELITSGSFFLGVEAYNLGLVDELGGQVQVQEHLAQVLGEEAVFVRFETEKSLFDILSGDVRISLIPQSPLLLQ